jgi:hypothetical protein
LGGGLKLLACEYENASCLLTSAGRKNVAHIVHENTPQFFLANKFSTLGESAEVGQKFKRQKFQD